MESIYLSIDVLFVILKSKGDHVQARHGSLLCGAENVIFTDHVGHRAAIACFVDSRLDNCRWRTQQMISEALEAVKIESPAACSHLKCVGSDLYIATMVGDSDSQSPTYVQDWLDFFIDASFV